MHAYRSHKCGDLRETHQGAETRLSGWVHRVRDHGGVLFIDLRDHYGITQVVADPDSPAFKDAEKLRSEWVVRIDGKVRRRPEGTDNPELPTGAVEVYVSEIEVLGPAAELPLPVFGEQEYPEDIRLKYRFLDLRREKLHQNIMTRGAIVPKAPSTRNCRPARSRSTSVQSRCWVRQASCRCRWLASRNILRTSGLSTGSSISVARSCTRTS